MLDFNLTWPESAVPKLFIVRYSCRNKVLPIKQSIFN